MAEGVLNENLYTTKSGSFTVSRGFSRYVILKRQNQIRLNSVKANTRRKLQRKMALCLQYSLTDMDSGIRCILPSRDQLFDFAKVLLCESSSPSSKNGAFLVEVAYNSLPLNFPDHGDANGTRVQLEYHPHKQEVITETGAEIKYIKLTKELMDSCTPTEFRDLRKENYNLLPWDANSIDIENVYKYMNDYASRGQYCTMQCTGICRKLTLI